jgi:hypothetical protein
MYPGIGIGIHRQKFAQQGGFFSNYALRVSTDGGTTEAGGCVSSASPLLQAASLLVIPSGYKAGKVYSQIPTNGSGDLIFSRETNATRVNSSNLTTQVSNNIQRLDYSQDSCPAFLFEPQRTNLIVNSVFSGGGPTPTSWLANAVNPGPRVPVPSTKTNIGVAYELTANSQETFFQSSSITIATNSSYVFSIELENIIGIIQYAQILAVAGQPAGSTMTYYRNGVQVGSPFMGAEAGRISAVLTTTTTGGSVAMRVGIGASGGNQTGTVVISCSQIEQGRYATSYISTAEGATTRITDTLSLNNIRTNGLISASGGTWYIELLNNIPYVRDSGTFPLFISTSSTSGAGSSGLEFRNNTADSLTRLSILKRISGTGTVLFTTTSNILKVAIIWNGTTADVFVNGVKEVTATAFSITNMQFLNVSGADVPLFIQAMALYPSPLSDEDCITLTT